MPELSSLRLSNCDPPRDRDDSEDCEQSRSPPNTYCSCRKRISSNRGGGLSSKGRQMKNNQNSNGISGILKCWSASKKGTPKRLPGYFTLTRRGSITCLRMTYSTSRGPY